MTTANPTPGPVRGLTTRGIRRRRALPADPSLRLVARSGTALFGVLLLAGIIGLAILAPMISPHDPLQQNLSARLQPPVWMAGGSPDHLLGTDTLGRDMLSRMIYGARISLLVGFAAVFIAGGIGVLLGLISGYFGKRTDSILGRLADIQLSIPFLVLAVAVVAIAGSSLFNIIVVLAITTWVFYFRIVRGEVLAIREQEYVWAARSIGAGDAHIMLRHILPNVMASIIVLATLLVANMIIFEAALSFLGLGVAPPTPTWGRMIADGREQLENAWWISFFPGLAIFLTVLAVNLIGDWLRDTYDPKQRSF